MQIDSKKVVDMIYCDKCGKYIFSLDFDEHTNMCGTNTIVSNAEIIK